MSDLKEATEPVKLKIEFRYDKDWADFVYLTVYRNDVEKEFTSIVNRMQTALVQDRVLQVGGLAIAPDRLKTASVIYSVQKIA